MHPHKRLMCSKMFYITAPIFVKVGPYSVSLIIFFLMHN